VDAYGFRQQGITRFARARRGGVSGSGRGQRPLPPNAAWPDRRWQPHVDG